MSSGAWSRQTGKGNTNYYNVEESLIIVEKSEKRRQKSETRITSANVPDNGYSREKRNPLLDRVKHTRLSCFRSSSNASQFDSPSTSSTNVPNSFNLPTDSNFVCGIEAKDPNFSVHNSLNSSLHYANENGYDSLPKSSCFAAKLRAMSEKYLQSSTNKFLVKLYKSQESPLSESTPTKINKRKSVKAKLRSFSYGALPGIEEFQRKHNPLYHEDDTNIMDVEDAQALLMDNEDSDSGILVTDSTSSSVLESDNFRCDNPPSFYTSPIVETHNFNLFELDIENEKIKKTHAKHVLSLDRKEIFKHKKPPALPAKITSKKTAIILVTLKKKTENDELGILIATKGNSGQGFVVAHVAPGGIAHRY